MKRGPKKAWPVQFQHIKVLGFACWVVLGTVCGVFSPLSFVLNFHVDQLSEMGWCSSCHWCDIRGISCHFCWTLAVLCLVGLFLCCLILAKVEVGWEMFQTKMMTLVEEQALRFFSLLGVCAFWLSQSWARGFYESTDLSGSLTMVKQLIPGIYPSKISLP